MQAVILAAGQSSRFWPLNKKHKSLFKVMGKPLICYTVENLKNVGIKDIIVIQGPKREIEEELKSYNLNVKYIIQKVSKGTGDALWQAKNLIKEDFILVGPHKLDLNKYLPLLLQKNRENPGKVILACVKTETPWEYGVLKLTEKKSLAIVENPPKGKEPSNIKVTETYILPYSFFKTYKKTAKKEDNLIDSINILLKKIGGGYVLLDEDTVSIKYPWHLLNLLKIVFRSRFFKRFISPSAIISNNVILKDDVYIGRNTKIGENSIIIGPCYIGDNCRIGINTVLRGPVILEDNVITGAFCEIKNSIIGKDTHFHSGYFGDSIVGENCRFGAGIVIANRRIDRNNIKVLIKNKKIDSGLTYLGTIIGDNSRFGINTSIMPGVLIGSNSIIGPGSIIFDNIKDNQIFYTQFKGISKRNI